MSVSAFAEDGHGRIAALTGGTGFIGGTAARQLLASGWKVKALARDRAKAQALADLGVEIVHGTLAETPPLQALVEGANAVVHCAGAVRGVTDRDFRSVNVDGLANLATIASHRGAPGSVFLSLSSLAARQPHLSMYAASKRAGEDTLAGKAGEMRWIVLRPPAVYGPGDREMLPLLQWMMRGIAPVLGPPSARFSLLYVDDLAAAIVRCLDCAHPPSGVFELHDGHPGGYDWGEVIGIAAELRGKRVAPMPISTGFLRELARLSVVWGKLSRRAPMLTPGKVRELTHPDWVCDNRALHQACGWTPEVDFREGLRRALRPTTAQPPSRA